MTPALLLPSFLFRVWMVQASGTIAGQPTVGIQWTPRREETGVLWSKHVGGKLLQDSIVPCISLDQDELFSESDIPSPL